MLTPEVEFDCRLKGISPTHEQQLRYAAIFRASPELAFAKAYTDGYHKAGCIYVTIIEQLVKRVTEENGNT